MSALACFKHHHIGKTCTLQKKRKVCSGENSVRADDCCKGEDPDENLYSNLTALALQSEIPSDCTQIDKEVKQTVPLSIDTKGSKAKAARDRSREPNNVVERGVTITCQRLNKDKVLENIDVDVTTEVYKALVKHNPGLKEEEPAQLHSPDFGIEKSVHEVKSVLRWMKGWKSAGQPKNKQITSL